MSDEVDLKESFKKLSQQIQASPKGHLVPKNKSYLLRSLRACNGDVEAALDQIWRMAKLKEDYPQFFEHIGDWDKMRRINEENIAGILEHRDRNGAVVFYLQTENWNPDTTSIEEGVAMIIWGFLSIFEVEELQEKGVTLIFNIPVGNFKQMAAISKKIRYIPLALYAAEKCMPLKVNDVHLVNQNSIFDHFFNLFKHFSSSLRYKMFLHGSSKERLFERFPREMLPTEIGGTAGKFSAAYTHTFIKDVEI